MVKSILRRPRAVILRALLGVVSIAAWCWVRRAVVVDTAGGVALVVAAALVAPAAGWLAAGAWLTVRGYGIERQAKTTQGPPR